MESSGHHQPYVTSTSQIQIRRTSLVIRSPSTSISDNSSPYSGAYGQHHHHHLHTHTIREEYTYSVRILQRSSSSSSSDSTRTPSPVLRPPPPQNTPPHEDNGITYTEDASTRLSNKIQRRCFNCGETKTTAWRRSQDYPGKLLCNKCGLAERKPPPTPFPEIVDLEQRQAKFASRGGGTISASSNSNKPPPPMSTIAHARSGVLPMQGRRCRYSAASTQGQGMLPKDHEATSHPISIL
ncbi:hypothetical protein E1B28_002093 [Marasmius oreades]|uniref:GATA-type domain-containing protein n=1 Tax=Marasmius oreades TaxID=181124 RepID=A0A9P7UNM3_9AGAR|nr:uncharacterized protein E1B28_002093 [Marasmius oreades]KAG7086134.1 hypothetical protein E1B28_002093 [Marasmius oreades]